MTTPGYTHRDGCLAVLCPTCDAIAGNVCVNQGLDTVPVHDERIENYRRLVLRAVSVYDEEGVHP